MSIESHWAGFARTNMQSEHGPICLVESQDMFVARYIGLMDKR